MIHFIIPGFRDIRLEHVVFDYNGTLAVDGKLITGVREQMNALAGQLRFHVITADTFGMVKREMEGIDCTIHILPEAGQAESKRDFAAGLGLDSTMAVGNGRNDRLMVKEAVVGVALLQEEGASAETMFAADVVCHSVLDVFSFFSRPKRLVASLRS